MEQFVKERRIWTYETTKQTVQRTIHIYIYINEERVRQRVKSIAFCVSQQFDRMSGMFADYFSNVILGSVCVRVSLYVLHFAFDHVTHEHIKQSTE